MLDILTQVTRLKRPDLLVRAARYGVDEYARNAHLRRCLQIEQPPGPVRALVLLLDIEKQLNSERLTKSGNYSVADHIDILIAIMAEARALQDPRANVLRLV